LCNILASGVHIKCSLRNFESVYAQDVSWGQYNANFDKEVKGVAWLNTLAVVVF
jgi:hypothetical protein